MPMVKVPPNRRRAGRRPYKDFFFEICTYLFNLCPSVCFSSFLSYLLAFRHESIR